MTSEKGQPGQYFEDFLKEQDTYESTTELAVKRVLAYQLSEEIKNQGISKSEMARRMHTSRSQLERLLDPCLLYTSPSPRDRTRSRMPSSA